MTVAARRLSWWGWGFADAALSPDETAAIGQGLAALLGVPPPAPRRPPAVESLALPPPRVSPPSSLVALFRDDVESRAGHAMGKSFRDVVRAIEGRIEHLPDLVALPRDEADVSAILEWCSDARVAAIPYGGGSSVVGGVEPDVGDGFAGAVSIDLGGLCTLLEVDEVSRAARFQAGMRGPDVEAALRPHGLTLRHFPQSFEHSTVGGWLATRSGGHFATLQTHIDDAVEALRMLTPRGPLETRRLPGSGAGPSPDRLMLGSEGILGIITEAWLRVHRRPRFRASATVRFQTFESGAQAARGLAQSGLYPANCRLLDSTEALLSGAGDGSVALLLVAFESADHDVGAALSRALEMCVDCGGTWPDGMRIVGPDSESPDRRDSAAGAWRSAFLRGPYIRDAIATLGWISETVETAITWERFADLHHDVGTAARQAVADICGKGVVACRLTHVYPDGCAPYFTVIAPSRPGSQVAQWDEIKAAVSARVLASGGTITHHHAIGRDHRRWYDEQRPPLFADALRAAKAALDPAGVLNPGVLLDRA